MNEEVQPDIDELDDAEGHKVHSRVDPAGEPDDTEGNGFRFAVQPADEADDTEGHSGSHKR